MKPMRMLAPSVAMLVGLTFQPLALLAAEGMKQPKPVLTAEPWNAWVKAEGYDENAPLPYNGARRKPDRWMPCTRPSAPRIGG